MFINSQTRPLHASEGESRDVRALAARNQSEGRYFRMKRHASAIDPLATLAIDPLSTSASDPLPASAVDPLPASDIDSLPATGYEPGGVSDGRDGTS